MLNVPLLFGGGDASTFDFLSGLLPHGAALTRASSGTRINSSGVLATETTDVARFTYNPVTLALQGLLNEPQRTNYILRSEEFGNAAWTPDGVTVSSNADAAPDGNTTADRLVETLTLATHSDGPTAAQTLPSAAHTFSVFAKPAERTWLWLEVYNGSGIGTVDTAWYNLATGVVGTTQAQITAAIVAAGSTWYRPSAMRTSTLTYIGVGLATGDAVSSYLGDITKGLSLWGAQIEDGADVSSYIATTTGSVTRSADVLTLSGLANGTYTMTINRLSGQTVVAGVSVSAGTYVVPTDVSPLQSVVAGRTA